VSLQGEFKFDFLRLCSILSLHFSLFVSVQGDLLTNVSNAARLERGDVSHFSGAQHLLGLSFNLG
jgi:hypothetical protein